MSYEVKLPLFEGPFDLLLFFIERDELDIYDIPISKITDDFLAYLKQLEAINIDLASEFILVAGTLMRIKSKMLIPRPEVNDEGIEVDPREELVKHLLEYKKYKAVIEELSALEDGRSAKYERGNVLKELEMLSKKNGGEEELHSLDMLRLLKTFEKVMHNFKNREEKPVHTIIQYPYTIDGQKELILARLQKELKINFLTMIAEAKDRIEAIYNFLSILELAQMQLLSIIIGDGYNQFWVVPFNELEILEANDISDE